MTIKFKFIRSSSKADVVFRNVRSFRYSDGSAYFGIIFDYDPDSLFDYPLFDVRYISVNGILYSFRIQVV